MIINFGKFLKTKKIKIILFGFPTLSEFEFKKCGKNLFSHLKSLNLIVVISGSAIITFFCFNG